ncbi:hypothetical protein Leryth_007672 [Lithospermum erythrorhizon]|nr:hypothetical protein Leryth_007672 [Lithospermum erythrorhizon]
MAYAQAAVTVPPESKPLIRQFYKKLNTCENVEAFVRHQVTLHWKVEKNITAKLLKLLYADCMKKGCDGSILLDGPQAEKNAPQIKGFGGYALIDTIKKVLEVRCPGAVSCADILMLATRDALQLVSTAGAPSYPVFLGRRDGLESKASWVDLPSPSISWEQGLNYFQSKGLDLQDYVTLLGGHSMGRTHCKNIRDRLYNFKNTGKPDPSMDKTVLNSLRKQCPQTLKRGQHDPLVYLTPESGGQFKFTNSYYKNVLANKSVLGVDQQLSVGNDDTQQIVNDYASSFEQFRRIFAFSISRMGGLRVLTGTKGEIRRNCRVPNKSHTNTIQ